MNRIAFSHLLAALALSMLATAPVAPVAARRPPEDMKCASFCSWHSLDDSFGSVIGISKLYTDAEAGISWGNVDLHMTSQYSRLSRDAVLSAAVLTSDCATLETHSIVTDWQQSVLNDANGEPFEFLLAGTADKNRSDAVIREVSVASPDSPGGAKSVYLKGTDASDEEGPGAAWACCPLRTCQPPLASTCAAKCDQWHIFEFHGVNSVGGLLEIHRMQDGQSSWVLHDVDIDVVNDWSWAGVELSLSLYEGRPTNPSEQVQPWTAPGTNTRFTVPVAHASEGGNFINVTTLQIPPPLLAARDQSMPPLSAVLEARDGAPMAVCALRSCDADALEPAAEPVAPGPPGGHAGAPGSEPTDGDETPAVAGVEGEAQGPEEETQGSTKNSESAPSWIWAVIAGAAIVFVLLATTLAIYLRRRKACTVREVPDNWYDTRNSAPWPLVHIDSGGTMEEMSAHEEARKGSLPQASSPDEATLVARRGPDGLAFAAAAAAAAPHGGNSDASDRHGSVKSRDASGARRGGGSSGQRRGPGTERGASGALAVSNAHHMHASAAANKGLSTRRAAFAGPTMMGLSTSTHNSLLMLALPNDGRTKARFDTPLLKMDHRERVRQWLRGQQTSATNTRLLFSTGRTSDLGEIRRAMQTTRTVGGSVCATPRRGAAVMKHGLSTKGRVSASEFLRETSHAAPLPPPGSARINVLQAKSRDDAMQHIHEMLDSFVDAKKLFIDKYRFMRGDQNRREGGQGIVIFAHYPDGSGSLAIKFFTTLHTFRAELEMYAVPALVNVLPEVLDVESNEGASIVAPNGTEVPPFVVMERGEPFDEWCERSGTPDFPTALQVMLHIAERLQDLHDAGFVHGDIKPSNLIWLPRTNQWNLIDFAGSRRIGSDSRITCTLAYAAPEVLEELEAGYATMRATGAIDVWALGMMVWMMLTGVDPWLGLDDDPRLGPDAPTLVFRQLMAERILGGTHFPWEDDQPQEIKESLGIFKPSVLQMLHRDPSQRPTMSELRATWASLFNVKLRPSFE